MNVLIYIMCSPLFTFYLVTFSMEKMCVMYRSKQERTPLTTHQRPRMLNACLHPYIELILLTCLKLNFSMYIGYLLT